LVTLLFATTLSWSFAPSATASGGVGPVLTGAGFQVDHVCRVTVTGATPYQPVAFAWSEAGGGPVNCSYGILSLSHPINVAPTIWADGWGVAVNDRYIPPQYAGRDIWLQAYDVASAQLTNGLHAVIAP